MTAPTGPHAPRVVLVGPPGAGKSTIGRKLARELGVPLYDTDAGIEEETGRTIPEIFAADGEPEFRRIEERVVRRAVLDELGVVSLGGGAVLSESTRALLRERTVVYLEISVAEGLRRTGASTGRPLLNGADPGAKYRELMRIRRPLYREVSSIRVRTDGRSPGRVVRAILAELGVETDAPEAAAPAAAPIPAHGGSRSRARRRARARAAGRKGQEPAVRGEADRAAKAAGSTRTPPERTATERISGDRVAAEGTAARAPRRRRRKRRVTATGRRPEVTADGGSTTGADAPGDSGTAGQAGAAGNFDAAHTRGTGNRSSARAGDAGESSSGGSADPAATGASSAEGGGRARRGRARRARGRNRLQTTRTDSEHT